jgi:hypothetical protein
MSMRGFVTLETHGQTIECVCESNHTTSDLANSTSRLVSYYDFDKQFKLFYVGMPQVSKVLLVELR